MRYVSLHHHSTFSFLDGFRLPWDHVERASQLGMDALALTEHGNIFSHIKLEEAANEFGIKPIYGCEFYMGYTDSKRRTQKKNHLTVLAKNSTGYRNLLSLVSRSWAEGFYYEATVDWDWLCQHREGLVILSGCYSSALFTAVMGGKHVPEEEAGYERGLDCARWFADNFPAQFYIELQAFPELEATCKANPILAAIADELSLPLVATTDCHYTKESEGKVQQILHNIRPGEKRTLEEQVQDWGGYKAPLCPPRDDTQLRNKLIKTGIGEFEADEAIENAATIAAFCSVVLPSLPRTRYSTDDEEWTFKEWIRQGWFIRGCDKLPSKERNRYRKQLAKEMELIKGKDYISYFLIVADAITYAKNSSIPVGPARGSAAASLVCYLMRITEVDPMKHSNLVFERFLDWTRDDLPDIDIDFATWGRSVVRDYLGEKYGEDRVANIGTFTKFKGRNSLDDVARAFRIPKQEVNIIKGFLIERASGDDRPYDTIEDTIHSFDQAMEVIQENPDLEWAQDLEGNIRQFGVHAAGLVVASEPIENVTATVTREIKGHTISVIGMDKDDAEKKGMNKLDFLGLATMDMIADVLDYAGMTVDDLYAIPLDDPKVIDGFTRNDTVGVFQFDGAATAKVNRTIKPDNFEEIALAVALSRPGPLVNQAPEHYADVKFGRANPNYVHPSLKPITEDTLGQIVYQEQIMRIVREIGGFDWPNTIHIRKVIGKKLGEEEFNRYYPQFRKGAKKLHGIGKDESLEIWKRMSSAGAYAFNAAHSVSYATIACWCMYLKQHYREDFYASALANLPEDRSEQLLRDAYNHGIELLPPSLRDSDLTWTPTGEGAIQAGWTQIPGIGERMAEEIVNEQHRFSSWEDLLEVPGIGPKKKDTIVSFSKSVDPFEVHKLNESIVKVIDSLEEGVEGGNGIALPCPNVRDFSSLQDVSGYVCLLGQPIRRVEKEKSDNLRETKFGQVIVRDSDTELRVIVSRKKYRRLSELIWSMDLKGDDLLLVEGRMADEVVFADNMWVLNP